MVSSGTSGESVVYKYLTVSVALQDSTQPLKTVKPRALASAECFDATRSDAVAKTTLSNSRATAVAQRALLLPPCTPVLEQEQVLHLDELPALLYRYKSPNLQRGAVHPDSRISDSPVITLSPTGRASNFAATQAAAAQPAIPRALFASACTGDTPTATAPTHVADDAPAQARMIDGASHQVRHSACESHASHVCSAEQELLIHEQHEQHEQKQQRDQVCMYVCVCVCVCVCV